MRTHVFYIRCILGVPSHRVFTYSHERRTPRHSPSRTTHVPTDFEAHEAPLVSASGPTGPTTEGATRTRRASPDAPRDNLGRLDPSDV